MPVEFLLEPYSELHQKAFRDLNVEWISKFFVMEETDYKVLDHPNEYILNKGGEILVVVSDKIPIGVCALIKMNDPKYDFELAKMAISPNYQGHGIGYKLGLSIIELAKKRGAQYLYLESNRKLTAAINLYCKLGFKEVQNRKSPYKRADILMELNLREF